MSQGLCKVGKGLKSDKGENDMGERGGECWLYRWTLAECLRNGQGRIIME